MDALIINARIITPYRILPPCWTLRVTDGKISALTDLPMDPQDFAGQVIDAQGFYLAPGFIDMHTHGAGGHDFMDGSPGCSAGSLPHASAPRHHVHRAHHALQHMGRPGIQSGTD